MKKEFFANHWEFLSLLCTILTFVAILSWRFSEENARISNIEKEVATIKLDYQQDNQAQDNNYIRFQDQVNNKLDRLADQVQQIYKIILENRK